MLTFNFNSNLSSEVTAYLETIEDPDAEDEVFRISASATARAPETVGDFGAAATKNADVTIDDAQEQVYELRLPVALESSGEIKEGNDDDIVQMNLVVSPARTVPKSFFVNLASAQDASDYSLTSRGVSSGGPTAVSLRTRRCGGRHG